MHTKQGVLALSFIPSLPGLLIFLDFLSHTHPQYHSLDSPQLFPTLPVPYYFGNEKVVPAWRSQLSLGPICPSL